MVLKTKYTFKRCLNNGSFFKPTAPIWRDNAFRVFGTYHKRKKRKEKTMNYKHEMVFVCPFLSRNAGRAVASSWMGSCIWCGSSIPRVNDELKMVTKLWADEEEVYNAQCDIHGVHDDPPIVNTCCVQCASNVFHSKLHGMQYYPPSRTNVNLLAEYQSQRPRCKTCRNAERESLRLCKACLAVYYCSSRCQAADYTSNHRNECGRLRANGRPQMAITPIYNYYRNTDLTHQADILKGVTIMAFSNLYLEHGTALPSPAPQGCAVQYPACLRDQISDNTGVLGLAYVSGLSNTIHGQRVTNGWVGKFPIENHNKFFFVRCFPVRICLSCAGRNPEEVEPDTNKHINNLFVSSLVNNVGLRGNEIRAFASSLFQMLQFQHIPEIEPEDQFAVESVPYLNSQDGQQFLREMGISTIPHNRLRRCRTFIY